MGMVPGAVVKFIRRHSIRSRNCDACLHPEEQRVGGFGSLDRAIAGLSSGLIGEEEDEPLQTSHVFFFWIEIKLQCTQRSRGDVKLKFKADEHNDARPELDEEDLLTNNFHLGICKADIDPDFFLVNSNPIFL